MRITNCFYDYDYDKSQRKLSTSFSELTVLKTFVSSANFRGSIVYDNILRLSQDSLRSTLTGHFQYRENDKKNAQLAA